MAKEKENKLTAARQILANEQAAYGKLIRKSTESMDASEKEEHTKACQKQLRAKRQAKETVEALRRGLPAKQKTETKNESERK